MNRLTPTVFQEDGNLVVNTDVSGNTVVDLHGRGQILRREDNSSANAPGKAPVAIPGTGESFRQRTLAQQNFTRKEIHFG